MNFQGLGLPEAIWNVWSELLEYITDANCTSSLKQPDATCVLPNNCSSYSEVLDSYSFQIEFSSNTSDYIRVPLSLFALDLVDNTCNIAVILLETDRALSPNVILGGLFFNEFVGVFQN